MRWSQFFNQISKNKKFTGFPSDPNTWPIEWRTIYYKTYPRLERIDLKPFTQELNFSLQDALQNRTSFRDFSQKPIKLSQLANLLVHSAGITHQEKRPYPSAGARYPLEIYIMVLRGDEGLNPGLYHYNVLENFLEILWKKDFLAEKDTRFSGLFSYPWTWDSACIVFITAIFERNQIKYGERGYRHILIEAGHLGQNIYLVSTALGLGCCEISGYSDYLVDELLDIDGLNESTINAFVIGPKA